MLLLCFFGKHRIGSYEYEFPTSCSQKGSCSRCEFVTLRTEVHVWGDRRDIFGVCEKVRICSRCGEGELTEHHEWERAPDHPEGGKRLCSVCGAIERTPSESDQEAHFWIGQSYPTGSVPLKWRILIYLDGRTRNGEVSDDSRTIKGRPDELRNIFAPLDWSHCSVVERIPDKPNTAWVLKGTRLTVQTIFENLAFGGSVSAIAEMFELTEQEVGAVVQFATSIEKRS